MRERIVEGARLPDAYMTAGSASFTDFLASAAPELLPGSRRLPATAVPEVPHGTTIVSVVHPGGVVMAGDRRATMGNLIAQRDIEKVFQGDEYSAVGIAGTAGIAVEMVRLFQVELEHYEKIEGTVLSLEGKANRLSTMIRGNLGLAMQGLAVVPLFAGYDLETGTGRIFSYDVTGGRYEEHSFYSVGSGSVFARGAMKKLYREGLSVDQAVRVAVEALYDAADDDSATGGPDLTRRIYPVVASVTDEGCRRLPDSEVGAVVQGVVDERMTNPGADVTTPFYTSPEQLVRDRSEYARKGISRGRSNVVLTYDGGIAFVAENPSKALHKISEIYDRIALAAVGRYNEFESLRVAGVRLADMRGYAYDRRDVTGRALANAYAQTLGSIFIEAQKPYEVEIVVAEVGQSPDDDQIYRLTYDGSVSDEQGFVAMGGQADTVAQHLRDNHQEGLSLGAAIGVAVHALEAGTAGQVLPTPGAGQPANTNGNGERRLTAGTLEVAILERGRPRRCFRRIVGPHLERLLSGESTEDKSD